MEEGLHRSQYFPQCGEISRDDFTYAGSDDFKPDDEDYYKDAVVDYGLPGIIIGSICLIWALILILWSFCLMCTKHDWIVDSTEVGKAFKGHWLHRLSKFLSITAIVISALAVIAVSAWGIHETEDKVKVVVPRTFVLVDRADLQLDSITGNVSALITNGNSILRAVNLAIVDVDRNPGVDLTQQNLGVINSFRSNIQDVQNALDAADDELNTNIRDIANRVKDVAGYDDESDLAERALRAGLIGSFALIMLISLVLTTLAVFTRSPRCTLGWVIFLWIVLVMGFGIGIGFMSITREVSEDSCLYIDEFSIEKVRDSVGFDGDRIEELLRYYFRPPENATKPLEEIETLWGLQLSEINDFLVLAESELYTSDGSLNPVLDTTGVLQESTQEALLAVEPGFSAAQDQVLYIQDLISGTTFHDIHKDVKDLLCCTFYDAVDSIWIAWIIASGAGFILGALVTCQVCRSVRYKQSPLNLPTAAPVAPVTAIPPATGVPYASAPPYQSTTTYTQYTTAQGTQYPLQGKPQPKV